jgi:hypothetical protein
MAVSNGDGKNWDGSPNVALSWLDTHWCGAHFSGWYVTSMHLSCMHNRCAIWIPALASLSFPALALTVDCNRNVRCHLRIVPPNANAPAALSFNATADA